MFNPFRAWHERREAERRLEREHQLAMVGKLVEMIESLGDAQVAQAKEQSLALVELAKSVQAQSASFEKWLDSFKLVDAPTSSVVTDEDEWTAEQKKLAEQLGIPADAVEYIPPEFKLALELRQQEFLGAVSKD